MRIDLTKIQVEAVAAMLRDALVPPEGGEADERLYLDTLEGETDLYELSRRLLNEIEEDEGDQKKLAEQIADRQLRKQRAAMREKARRDAIKALLQCARLDKLTLPEATISVRQTPPKPIVNDEEAVPEALCRIKRSPDMAAIKAELEAGRAVPGVTIDNGADSLTIRRK